MDEAGLVPSRSSTFPSFPAALAAASRHFNIADYISEKEAKKMDVFIHYGIAAGCQAFEDSGIEITEENADRIGVAIGAGLAESSASSNGHNAYLKGGPRKISPFFVPSNIINMISGNLSIQLGLKGPNFAIVTACTTGTHNIGEAARVIMYGDADVMVAGGAEMATSPTSWGICLGQGTIPPQR
jgi:3-oxoacyl-[acyl-carrier-protein] synthase II